MDDFWGIIMAEYTPMIQQYLKIKAEYQDAFLFFRLGDFYEMFFDDAIKASQELEITASIPILVKGSIIPVLNNTTILNRKRWIFFNCPFEKAG